MRRNYKQFFKALFKKVNDDDIVGNAAQVAFYFSFALFPLLLFLMSLLGIVLSNKEELQTKLFLMLAQVMPPSAFELVRATMEEVTSRASGGKLTLGIVITLWSASAGVDNLRSTLNQIYNLKETRSWLKATLTSVLLTLVVGLVMLAALGISVYGSHLIGYVLPAGPWALEVLEWVATLVMLLLVFALLYNFAPNHEPMQWKWITPGSVVGIALWLLVSAAFRLYLKYFDSYAATYGSLGAVIILLLWLYMTALAILIGGAINAVLDEASGIKKRTADPKQKAEEKTKSGKSSRT